MVDAPDEDGVTQQLITRYFLPHSQTLITSYFEKIPVLPVEPFPFMKLPPEIRNMVYRQAWRDSLPEKRYVVVTTGQYIERKAVKRSPGDWCTYWAFSRTLWYLSQACRESRETVLPYVFKGVDIESSCPEDFDFAQPGQLTRFFSPWLKHITNLTLYVSLEHGFAVRFTSYMDELSQGRYLDNLHIGFVWDQYLNEELIMESDDLDIVCYRWQSLRVNGSLTFTLLDEPDLVYQTDAYIDMKLRAAERIRQLIIKGMLEPFAEEFFLCTDFLDWIETNESGET
ncbi:hypothetical protein ANO11243_051130 [Dothideomycetidae sp. 11243]|nr:hypothetical protein ANO11243_051130 [fungal sp. No.11243]